jgi:uncharacterized protein DUF6151
MVPCGLVIAGIDVARLPLDLPLRCRCGHVRGIASAVSSSTGGRVLCYCKDCQAFARFLERADVLDAAGGTDIFQMPPGRVNLTAGMDAVRCLRLSNRGVYRWYTDCCRTPIGNIAGPRVPLIGVIHCFMDHQADGHSRDPVARPAPLPNLRTLRRRATPADGARAAVVRAIRPPRIEDVRLVDARARSADSVLRR